MTTPDQLLEDTTIPGSMVELYGLKGPRYRVVNIHEDAMSKVRRKWPGAVVHGSVGHWIWWAGGTGGRQVVAEAWPGKFLDNHWHLRVRRADKS